LYKSESKEKTLFGVFHCFDVLGTNNEKESDTCGLQYPDLSISNLHLVARILGCICKNFSLLNIDESGKHRK